MQTVFFLNGCTGAWDQKILSAAEFKKLQDDDSLPVDKIVKPPESRSQMMTRAILSKKRSMPAPILKGLISDEDDDETGNVKPLKKKRKVNKKDKEKLVLVDKDQSKFEAKEIRSILETQLKSIQDTQPKCPSATLDLLYKTMEEYEFSKFSSTLGSYNLCVAKAFLQSPGNHKQTETVDYQIHFKEHIHQMVFVHVEVGPTKNDVITFALKVNKKAGIKNRSNVYMIAEKFLYQQGSLGSSKTSVVVSHQKSDISVSVGGEVRISSTGTISNILKSNLISTAGSTLNLSVTRFVGLDNLWCETKVKQLTSSRKMESNDLFSFVRVD